VHFADGASRTAVVGDEGWIESVTDENGFATSYAYDAMGRITQVTYPAGDSVAWAPTTSTFAPVASAENGVAAGHWRQTVSTGNARKVTLFDALWRPVLVREYDAGDVASTDHYVATAYDKAGRVADASYPLATAPTLTSSGTWLLGSTRPNGVRTSYDDIGRPTAVQQDSELGVLTTTTDYPTGFMRRTTDARGKVTTEQFMAWDAPSFDWPVRIDAPEEQTTLISRDVFGKPVAITRGSTP
jgi:YD repeat-containing protein